MSAAAAYTLEVTDIRKSFGSVEVLRGINLTIKSGEFVGLMGPNGAGKSTLIKILDGVYTSTSGVIRLGGRAVTSLADLPEVGFIHQDLGLVDALTIAENFALANPPLRRVGPILNKRAEREAAARALRLVGLDLHVDSPLSELTPGQKTLVAVARVMDRGARIIIVDEATSTLPPAEASGVIRSLAAATAGGATVIMVTHKLSEILHATNRVVVLLDGELVRDAPTEGLDRAALVQMLMQHETDPHDADDAIGDGEAMPVIELREVRRETLGPLNLKLNAGEVIGISGLPGSGLHDIAFLVHGTFKPDVGEVIKHRPNLVTAMVPPHRESQGGFAELSVQQNLAISSLARWRQFLRLLNPRREALDCADVAANLSVKPTSIDTTFDVLSGGNKQKAIFGRALLKRPDVFVLCEPTRGVDVGTRSEIYRLIRQLAREGSAVLVASSDAEDLFSVCDRVALVADSGLQPLRYVSDLTMSELEQMV